MLANQEINLSEHHDTHLTDVLNMRNTQQHAQTLSETSLPIKVGIQTHADGFFFYRLKFKIYFRISD